AAGGIGRYLLEAVESVLGKATGGGRTQLELGDDIEAVERQPRRRRRGAGPRQQQAFRFFCACGSHPGAAGCRHPAQQPVDDHDAAALPKPAMHSTRRAAEPSSIAWRAHAIPAWMSSTAPVTSSASPAPSISA